MPIKNLGIKHISTAQIASLDAALDSLTTVVMSITQSLSDEERIQYGSIQERNKLFVNGVYDFANNQPALRSPDVDWTEFDLDYLDRKVADTRADRLESILRMLTDFKIVHDYDNYQNALTDYEYTKYKSKTDVAGYNEKHQYLKQFFAHSSAKNVPPSQ